MQVREVANPVYRKSIDYGNTSKALGALSEVGIGTANNQKALGGLDSRGSRCAPHFVPVLAGPCFADHASPFQSSRLSIARAMKRARDWTATPPRTRRVRGGSRFLPQPLGRERSGREATAFARTAKP